MNTVLNDMETLVLDCIEFKEFDKELKVYVWGKPRLKPGEPSIHERMLAGEFTDPEQVPKGDRFLVSFESCSVWQVVDEGCVDLHPKFKREGEGFLQVVVSSLYLDLIKEIHHWAFTNAENPKLYTIWTEHSVIYALSGGVPKVSAVAPNNSLQARRP